jgi:hypothetical protein
MHTVYPQIRSGTVQLWRTGWNSPLCTVCRNAQNAQVYGSDLVVSFTDGSTTLYRIIGNGSNAVPVRTTR